MHILLHIDDMPAGQTPHTVTLYAHHDLVDSVQPGDRCGISVIGMCYMYTIKLCKCINLITS